MSQQMKTWVGGVLLATSCLVVKASPDIEDLGEAYFSGQPRDMSQHVQPRELTLSERIQKIEHQLAALSHENADAKFEQLQAVLQELRGDVEKQAHDIVVLAEQQKKMYQDIQQRLATVTPSTSAGQQPVAASEPEPHFSKPQVASAQPAQKINGGEHQSYRDAFELLKAKQFDEAAKAFKHFIAQYPAGVYVVNAYYWLGEIYYLQGNSDAAKQAFSAVVKDFPGSQKLPDALLKLAVIEIDAGNGAVAKDMLKKISRQYPGTTASRLAAIRLQELNIST